MAVTGDEYVRLSQLKMLSDNLESDILGQFSDELDTIIGGDTTPVTDITARLAVVNGTTGNVDVQLDTLDGTKSAIKEAIIAKGVEVPEGTVFRDYATKIGEISTGSSWHSASVLESAAPTSINEQSNQRAWTKYESRYVYIPIPENNELIVVKYSFYSSVEICVFNTNESTLIYSSKHGYSCELYSKSNSEICLNFYTGERVQDENHIYYSADYIYV